MKCNEDACNEIDYFINDVIAILDKESCVESIAISVKLGDGDFLTGYLNAPAFVKMQHANHITVDANMDIIKAKEEV